MRHVVFQRLLFRYWLTQFGKGPLYFILFYHDDDDFDMTMLRRQLSKNPFYLFLFQFWSPIEPFDVRFRCYPWNFISEHDLFCFVCHTVIFYGIDVIDLSWSQPICLLVNSRCLFVCSWPMFLVIQTSASPSSSPLPIWFLFVWNSEPSM